MNAPRLPHRDEEMATSDPPSPEPPGRLSVPIAWMAVNTLATVGIVFINKAIFSDASWRDSQLTFACFHFCVTWITLFVLASPGFACFAAPRRPPIRHLLPLALAMCLNVILPNCSLAFSSVTFYQVARVLLTPVVALVNFLLYGATLPLLAGLALVPACLGVGIVSYYDSLPAADVSIKTTSPLGVVFALTGVLASSFYTVWIASYHRKLQMSSMQLLYSQAPIASLMLLYVIPFLDALPDPSGVFASLINISQFFIVAHTGPVSSTVVGHVKTCTIVCIGWIVSGRSAGDRALVGVCLALAAIVVWVIPFLKCHMRRLPPT
ncbi:hypothetical protein L249_8013 [Ophiocordyceps polyrhachis-furcata BCC 54312]|uniref:GDP-mannose transporter n=1 Tax=Ophiocordyceps polyrhachis-furcata BCC 54312 TaxID=1330021 RepID=A0A367LI27_9HYPO|nr:hypothetical protein L249_8013 [Ophiocordyceps polyrhachis-furcata BCC 54312]